MFKHCYARVRAWFSGKLLPVPAPKERWTPGPRVQLHMLRAARKAKR